jgi:hypothetical protein
MSTNIPLDFRIHLERVNTKTAKELWRWLFNNTNCIEQMMSVLEQTHPLLNKEQLIKEFIDAD